MHLFLGKKKKTIACCLTWMALNMGNIFQNSIISYAIFVLGHLYYSKFSKIKQAVFVTTQYVAAYCNSLVICVCFTSLMLICTCEWWTDWYIITEMLLSQGAVVVLVSGQTIIVAVLLSLIESQMEPLSLCQYIRG